MSKPLLSPPLTNCDDSEKAVQYIITRWMAQDRASIVHFVYYSNFVLMQKDKAYYEAMALADHILIDGIGMQLYLKAVKRLWPNNLNGTDLNPILLKALDRAEVPSALYGTTEENIRAAAANIRQYLPGNTLYYVQNGFTPLDWSKIAPNTALFIGMGSPRQELWVSEHLEIIQAKKLLVVTVGGFFDFASGFYIRAPKWVRMMKLEWAWRTMLHPGRHLKKRLRDLSILYRPLVDRLTGRAENLRIIEI